MSQARPIPSLLSQRPTRGLRDIQVTSARDPLVAQIPRYKEMLTSNQRKEMATGRCYHPQGSCGKVMFLHLSAILCTGRGAIWQTPPRQTPPMQTSPLGRHPPPSPWADTLPRQAPTMGRHPPGQTPPRQTHTL